MIGQALKPRGLLFLCAAVVFTAGCAISVQQKPEVNLRKPPNAMVLVLGELTSDKPGWAVVQPQFRKVVLQVLTDRKAFATVVDGSPRPDGALVLVGSVTEMDEGDRTLRAVVGFGAGKANLKGRFEIRDASDVTVLRFETHGAGYGGGLDSFLGEDIKVMVAGFATSVAHTVSRWSRGDLAQ